MKIHLKREETTEKTRMMQYIGLEKPTKCWVIRAYYELNEEERAILEQNPETKSIKLFDYEYEGCDLSPRVGFMTDHNPGKEGGRRYVAYDLNELNRLETEIAEGARKLKDHLYSLKAAAGSSSTVEEI